MLQEGFARFAVAPYTTAATQLYDSHVHLTNSSIHGNDPHLVLPDTLKPPLDEPHGRSKISLKHLWRRLAAQGIQRSELWPRVCEVALAALVSAQDSIPHQVCFPRLTH